MKYLRFLNKLYNEDLMDPEYYKIEDDKLVVINQDYNMTDKDWIRMDMFLIGTLSDMTLKWQRQVSFVMYLVMCLRVSPPISLISM